MRGVDRAKFDRPSGCAANDIFNRGKGNILRIIKANDGNVYEAPNHFNMWGIRKFGTPEGAKAVSVSVSEFLPNGGATLSASDKERIYVVLRGSITVKSERGEAFTLAEEDMIYIAPGEKREMSVNGIYAARVLVIIASC